ncbi:MAG: TraR/DksA C4-type zinc finger protein [Actinobacteria bacterium]|nr:TraR/DksA C4-type zinc finger protein [Actinomycetota bacterium]
MATFNPLADRSPVRVYNIYMAENTGTNIQAAVDYRSLLDQERADLLAKLSELGYGAEKGLEYDSNFADSSQVTAERGEVEALIGKLVETLEQVDGAIAKLENGTYGICESCGNRIEEARLEAKPAARMCIVCASKR